MADPLVVFRLRSCRAAGCGALFWICRRCDRGHRYCSVRCRQQVRRQQCREANRRHQQSPEGRLDHRDRQRAYRRRPERVTDQGRREDRIFVSMAAVASLQFSLPGKEGEPRKERHVPSHGSVPAVFGFAVSCVVGPATGSICFGKEGEA